MLKPGPAVALSCASFCLTDDQMLMGSALRGSAGLLDAADCHGWWAGAADGMVAGSFLGCCLEQLFGLLLVVARSGCLADAFMDSAAISDLPSRILINLQSCVGPVL
ncbi:hypothetical protein Nepgr_023090 [Nepenthes gracilis]|uniref:Uncharacterized protein n=1 Tax=Nepenthes gracilis TaxID=150966 RepID=A0AAD3T1F5_NEPGR|nr:hypothetical protein Nepgr_023090 [Nepenthes gracilis]